MPDSDKKQFEYNGIVLKNNQIKILVAGGTGLVGQQLTKQLVDLGADVFVCSLDNEEMAPKGIKDYYKLDMSIKENCKKVCEDKILFFHCLVQLSPATNEIQQHL